MGFVELPDQAPPSGGKLQGTIVLDEQELQITVSLLKDALAELTKGMANGVTHASAAAADPSPAHPAALPAHQVNLPRIRVQAPPQQQQQQVMGPPGGQQQQQQQPQPAARALPAAMAPYHPGQAVNQGHLQPQQLQGPAIARAPVPAVPPPRLAVAALAPPQATARPTTPPRQAQAPQREQQQQQQRQQQRQQPYALQQPPQQQQPRPPPQQQQQQQPQPQQPSQQQWGAPAVPQQQQQRWAAPAAPQQARPQQQQLVGSVDAAPAPASSHWKHAFRTESEEHGGQLVAALSYCKQMPPPLPSGDGHSGWLVSSSKGVINLWETNRAVPGECVLMCMHSQAVDLTCTKLVLEPSTKLMFGASLTTSDASECVSVHSLDAESLLAYRYKFGPPSQQPRADKQRLMQQVVSLHGMNTGVRHTVMTSFAERLLLFSTKESAKVPAHTLVHQSKLHFIAHPGSTVTALQTSQGIQGESNLLSGALNGTIHIWDLSQPPRDNSPAMRLNRHSQQVTGLAQITDERLVSSSMDGTVMLWDLRNPSGPLYTQRAPGGAAVLKIAPGPWGDVMAVGTAKGLHCVELFDFDAPMTNIADYPLTRPYTDLVFNAVTHDLYAATMVGSIHVYSRRA